MEVPYDAIFVMGPQGSGKGTQAKILAEKLGFFYWGMGGILRSMEGHVVASGKTVAEIIDQGFMLEDEDLTQIIMKKLPEVPAGQGIIFDGVPRRIGQARFLVEWLKEHQRPKLATVFLAIPKEESLRRLALRTESESRLDDTPEGIATRLRLYEENTVPIVAYMREKTTFLEVNGVQSIEEVTAEIFKALGVNK